MFAIWIREICGISPRYWLFGALLVWFCIDVAHPAAPAGTVIKNQASASYRDATGVLRFTTSNVVETLIQQVAALQLAQDQSRPAVAGRQILLTHTIVNTGNGSDYFNLVVQNASGDNFDLNSLAVYADTDQNGQPDVLTPISQTPVLELLENWSFVIVGQVPGSVAAGDLASLQVTATSNFDSGIAATNTDQITITDGAVIEMDKSISETSGLSPSGPFTVTLSYRNTGAGDAHDLTLIDALPAGMDYVTNSARWSGTGAPILSDDNSDTGADSDPRISYCAYHASCVGYAEADADSDSDSTNQVTAIISTVEPGEAGQVIFSVDIAGGLNAAVLYNTAEFEYAENSVVSQRQSSNAVAFDVLHQPAVVLNGSLTDQTDGTDEPQIVASMAQGSSVSYTNVVWNTGNDSDVFDITVDAAGSTFPAGSVYSLLQSDGVTPLLDSNGNGLPDTGPVAAGGNYAVVLSVLPPADAAGDNAGTGYEFAAMATSSTDLTVSNQMLNRLLNISTASVDITNEASLPSTDATGVGVGPETDPVSTFPVLPGSTATIDLYINNVGEGEVDFELLASTDSDFHSPLLPEDWIVEFRMEGEDDQVTSTGLIDAGAFKKVTAQVSIPANAEPADVSIYFRVLSELTGAMDIKHDQISIVATPELLLELDQEGQTSAGGSYVYHHTLSNTGNVAVPAITLSVADQNSGWSSIMYEDTNSNGVLDASDLTLTGIAELAAEEAKKIFVKVFAPTGAAGLVSNQTTLTATWGGGTHSAHNIDTTTVAAVEVSIVKEQAPDFGCTGTPDSAYSVGGFAVEPGNNCVSYRLTATNYGLASAFNVEIADATPAFTEYFGAASCSHGSCSIAEPAAGGQGNVIATIPELGAGAIVTLNFSVRVE